MEAQFFKADTADEEQRVVYGWATIVTKASVPVEDLQGDVISADELVLATTDFMKSARVAKMMHQGDQIGEVIHSFPLTYDIAKSLGIQTNDEGWLVGIYVKDDKVWKAVKDGSLAAFSIGGSGTREKID